MTPQTVRAILAYLMSGSLVLCLLLFVFVNLSTAQSGIIGTVLGAIIGNSKVPLAYFFDGVAIAEQAVSTASTPTPDGTATATSTDPKT